MSGNQHLSQGCYDQHLDRNDANYVPLSPLSFLPRSAAIFPDRVALVHGDVRRTWRETYRRCRQFASALHRYGIGDGDTVSLITTNTPEMYEAHFGVPMAGAVLNSINTRLDADAIAFILEHGESKLLIVDRQFADVARAALEKLAQPPIAISVDDPMYDGPEAPIGDLDYEAFLAMGDPDFAWQPPSDEWQSLTLNYTSGTTGDPKGVVYSHRGAYLNAVSNVMSWQMGEHPVYLWTLPMFHCNGWCFPWTMAAVSGTSVCLRSVRAEPIFAAIRRENVTHFCGAPIVLNILGNAADELKAGIDHPVKVMTAGASPPASVIEAMESCGIEVTHVYGLTEVYGPTVVCVWQDKWNTLPVAEKAALKARQGVAGPMLEGLMVADPETLKPVAQDGETIGEVFMRGNNVMKGYLKNPRTTAKTMAGGWLHTGDLAVWHEDGYIEIKDRAKDIIISGGENISSVEVEDVLYRHPDIMEAAVVAKPDAKWGETPCAFVSLKPGRDADEGKIIAYCRSNMAHFKAPKTVVFSDLPKTSTGKVQKFVLRQRAKAL